MSVKDGKEYLYLIWKCSTTRRQYIIGQLSRNGEYEFQYCGEIKAAMDAGFKPLVVFENLDVMYRCKELFPVFSSRLPDRKRKDIGKILDKYGLKEYDAYELLKKSGARLPIDNLQFVDPLLDVEEKFEKTFYLAGVRHYLGCEGKACKNAVAVTRGDECFLCSEPDNPYDKNAIIVLNERKEKLGYIPRYYAQAFLKLMNEKRISGCYVAKVEKEQDCDECIEVMVKVEKTQN